MGHHFSVNGAIRLSLIMSQKNLPTKQLWTITLGRGGGGGLNGAIVHTSVVEENLLRIVSRLLKFVLLYPVTKIDFPKVQYSVFLKWWYEKKIENIFWQPLPGDNNPPPFFYGRNYSKMFIDLKKTKKKLVWTKPVENNTEIAEGQDCSHGLIDFQPSARMNVEKTSYVSPVKFSPVSFSRHFCWKYWLMICTYKRVTWVI